MNTHYTVYFAGALFDHKDLIGNALLGSSIEKHSEGRYEIILPQDSETADRHSVEIRDRNLKRLIQCDMALFNFDGLELDSGTVVEFVIAKYLDIPSVILRSDLRKAGDQDDGGDNWNLMCSFFPRTKTVELNAMAVYQRMQLGKGSLSEKIEGFYGEAASKLIASLDAVRAIPPLLDADPDQLTALYQWALKFPGGNLAEICSNPSFVSNIIRSKTEKRLL